MAYEIRLIRCRYFHVRQNSSTKESSVGTSRWGDSPWIAFAIRVLVFAVPVFLSLFVTWSVARGWEAPTTIGPAILRFGVLAVVAVVVGAAADKLAKRFLPLAALFRLSLVFPDQAPSRFAVALRSGNTRRIEQRLAEVEAGGFRGDEADAALLVVELAAALSKHDRLTRGHSERVRAYTALIAEEMGLSAEDSNKLQWAGLIHDVGKLRIPESILTKPGRLTDDEFEIIKTHPAEGLKIAAPLHGFLGAWMGAVGEHHERFDGGGYPNGLAGTDISLAGRIVAVADAYDVITAARSYKKPLAPAFARRELADNAGTQFDPVVVRAFLSISLGRLRRAMWPLSWAVQVPFLGTAITTPVAQTIAATVVTIASATGVTAATGGFDAFGAPEALAMVEIEAEAADPAVAEEDLIANDVSVELPDNDSIALTPADTPGAERTFVEEGEVATADDADDLTKEIEVAETTAPASDASPTTTPTPTTLATTTTSTTTAPLSDCERAQTGDIALAGADLRRCDMSDLVLSGAVFDGANLTDAVLSDTKFLGGSFVGADFDGAELTGSEINNADLRNTSWSGATLRLSGLANVDLSAANLSNVKIEDTGISGNLSDAVFDGSLITRTGFDGSTMTNASFQGASIRQSSFTSGSLPAIDLRNSEMHEVSFENASMDNAQLSNSTMSSMVFVLTTLAGANFDMATLADSNLYGATITNASFVDARLSNMNMVDVVGGGANFTRTQLDGGTMVTAQLANAVFSSAEITGWDFNGATVTNAKFDRATFATSSLQSADASGSNFRSADFGVEGLWFFNATLDSADFSAAVGMPSEPAAGNYNNTVCPNGTVQSSTCW